MTNEQEHAKIIITKDHTNLYSCDHNNASAYNS